MTKDGQGQGAAASPTAERHRTWYGENKTQKNCSLTKMDANHKIIVYPNRERCD